MRKHCDAGIGKIPRVAVLASLISLMAFSTFGQGDSPRPPGTDDYRISVDVGLVVLPVVVTDGKGKAVTGLEKDGFQVFEDGRPQQITFFVSEDVPVTVGLVIDNSGSMSAKRPEVIAAAEEFAKSSNPQDEMFVVNFNQSVSLGLPKGILFTSDINQLRGAVSGHPAAGNTALYDGLAVALDHMKKGSAIRKALIVISDGGDNASRLKLPALLKRAEASNVQIYTLGVFDDRFAGENSGVLKRLAKVTGGQAYFPTSPSQMKGICRQIARTLRHQYTLGYHPRNSNSVGTFHAIRVTARAVREGRLHVSTRAGYLMPSDAHMVPPPPAKASL